MAVPGFYIASDHIYHRYGLYKVGFSADLRTRVHDYTTGSPYGFYYIYTIETETDVDARSIEQRVLDRLIQCRTVNHEGCRTEFILGKAPEEILEEAKQARILGSMQVFHYKKYPRKPASSIQKTMELLTNSMATIAERPVIVAAERPVIVSAKQPVIASVEQPVHDGGEMLVDENLTDLDAYKATLPKEQEARQYQLDAKDAVTRAFQTSKKCQLYMACRSGKTYVAHIISQDYKKVLILVPGRKLLQQTVAKIETYGYKHTILQVGSVPGGTTDPEVIRMALQENPECLVVSTYQSSVQLPDVFDLEILDEAHVVCGGDKHGVNSHVLLRHKNALKLSMTASPDTSPYSKARDNITMSDQSRFGPPAYEYTMRQGIDAGYVNDYELVALSTPVESSMFSVADISELVREIMTETYGCLVFVSRIAEVDDVHTILNTSKIVVGDKVAQVLKIHSKMSERMKKEALSSFMEVSPEKPIVMINCDMLGVGYECPKLPSVFFARPMSSPFKIIQALNRANTKIPNKPKSKVFVPIFGPIPKNNTTTQEDFERYQRIVDLAKVLRVHDSNIHRMIIANRKFVRVHGVESSDLDVRISTTLYYDKWENLAKKKSPHFQFSKVPWDVFFSQLEYTVTTCQRYPRTSDTFLSDPTCTSDYYAAYRKCCEEYGRYIKRQPSILTADQVRQLELLPSWEFVGKYGTPYPPESMLYILKEYFKSTKEMPLVGVGQEEHIGLNATSQQRLSGFFRTVNQQDAHSRFSVPPHIAAELDTIFGSVGLRWRKLRDCNGNVIDDGKTTIVNNMIVTGALTCIQESSKKMQAIRKSAKSIPSYKQYLDANFPDIGRSWYKSGVPRSVYEAGKDIPKKVKSR